MDNKTIVGYPLNGIQYDAEDAQTYLCTRTSGIFSDKDHFGIGGIVDNRYVIIQPGLAWMKITPFGGISFALKEAVQVYVEGGGDTDRTDLIVLRYDGNNNECSVACKKNSTSVDRDNNIFELGLYKVFVAAGSTQIIGLASDVQDVRLTELCGIMKDGVTGIPVDTLIDEFEAKVNETISNLENSGSVVISELVESKHEFDEVIVDANQAVDDFKLTTAPNAIADFESDALEKFVVFSEKGDLAITDFNERGDLSITDFNERGDLALQNLDDAVKDVTSGADVMLQTSFNPSGQVGQVAFEKNTKVYICSMAENSRFGSFRVHFPFRDNEKKQELIDAIKRGDNIVFRTFTIRTAGEVATAEEERIAYDYINDGGYEFNTIFDTSKPVYDFRLVSISNVNSVTTSFAEAQEILLIGMINFQWYAIKAFISSVIDASSSIVPLSSYQEE